MLPVTPRTPEFPRTQKWGIVLDTNVVRRELLKHVEIQKGLTNCQSFKYAILKIVKQYQ